MKQPLIQIEVHPPSRSMIQKMARRFALQQDDWNDYSFQTLYHLYFRQTTEQDDIIYIGGVKILKKDQTKYDSKLINKSFHRLGSDWASVGTSLDYYQRLNEIPEKSRASIMRALKDVVAYPDLVEKFCSEEGWQTSLFRDNPEWRLFLDDATILYKGNFAALPDIKEHFSYTPAGSKEAIEFDFSAPTPNNYSGSYNRVGPSRKRTLFPERVIVLVGRNGSGKSTLLSRLARIAFASPQDRLAKDIKALGKIKPQAIGFMRVITISYSAFDSFIVPGNVVRDLSQITEDIEKGDGRFVFCGLRDIVAEVRDDIENAEQSADDGDGPDNPVERRTSTKLKSVDALATEFSSLLSRIRKRKLEALLEAALGPIKADPSFAEIKNQIEEITRSSIQMRKQFLTWSTGHKIVMHVIASLVANARPRSLVLFDEPEAHLHPPLMAALMHAVRIVLAEVNAFCIVATHSPVLLQETLARHVRYVSRTGSQIRATEPKLETFGENIGVLTYDSFGLTASTTDYHHVLDLLVDAYDKYHNIEKAFEAGMSGQARAYVMSKLAKKRKG